MNNVINYSIIIILSLISLIGFININSVEKKLKLKGTKIVLFFIILMTYMTLVSYPVKNILNKNIQSIKLPKGKKGARGDRGKSGSSAICDTCGDDLCLKKILFNITNTYNYWRSLNGLNIYSDSFVIKNEYLKDKIIKHCKSKEFQKIIKKFGSNNKTGCTQNLREYGCGAYDYMFKMWSIWTLIILKYKNGAYFLESDSLTDVDFDGLIEPDDCFLDLDIVIYNGEKYTIDKSQESKRIHPMYHIRKLTNPASRNIVHFKSLTLCTENTDPALDDFDISDVVTYQNSNQNPNRGQINNPDINRNRSWNLMFEGANANLNTQYQDINREEQDYAAVPGLKIKRIKRNIDFGRTNPTSRVNTYDNTIEFRAQGVNEDFFKNDGIPDRGRLNPFEEIKRYDAWYWGRDEKLKPEIIVSKPQIDDLKKTCPSGRIKIKRTNDYNVIFTTKNKTFNTQTAVRPITLSDILSDEAENDDDENSDLFFLRPSKFIDKNEHGYFKEYRPIGDVLIRETEIERNLGSCSPTFPSTTNENDGYNGIIKNKIENLSTDSYLVSGDIKSPIDYELQWIYKKQHGINRGSVGLSIWKPIAPQGYKALGFVADQRYFNFPEINPENLTDVSFDTIKRLRGLPKPSLDIIACVPNDLLININNNEFTQIRSHFWRYLQIVNTKKYNDGENIFFRNNELNTFINITTKDETDAPFNKKIDTSSTVICRGTARACDYSGDNMERDCEADNECVYQNGSCRLRPNVLPHNPRTSIKDKKYSILRLYDK